MNDMISTKILNLVKIHSGIHHENLTAKLMAEHLAITREEFHEILGSLIEQQKITPLNYYTNGGVTRTIYFPENTHFTNCG